MVGKLCSSKRQQNALAAAIKEYGALRRTIYAARYLADETYRRRISRQLNTVVTWTTEYHGLAVTALRRGGRDIDDAVLAHIWPTHHENVHFYGTHSVDVDGELAKFDSDGYRPLRAATATEAPVSVNKPKIRL